VEAPALAQEEGPHGRHGRGRVYPTAGELGTLVSCDGSPDLSG